MCDLDRPSFPETNRCAKIHYVNNNIKIHFVILSANENFVF